MSDHTIAVIGGGPAGLSAAELLSAAGCRVTVYEAMPTAGRKFLLAGKSGLNLTHSEPYDIFRTRFGASNGRLAAALDAWTPADIREWAAGLGTQTFAGSSGRVFPAVMKASPLLRSWVARLTGQGVTFRTRHRWLGFTQDGLRFETPEGEVIAHADAALLALGGASWPRLGGDGAWVAPLAEKGIAVNRLRPANCGFDCDWSPLFRERFSGAPLKYVALTSAAGSFPGEFVISRHGIEGSAVYTHSAALRDAIAADGTAILTLDLAPGRVAARLERDLARQDAKASFSTRLRKGAGLDGVKAALLREAVPQANRLPPQALAGAIKALPVTVLRPRPIGEAISSAGGIAWDELDENYGLKKLPGVFAAGEMLDWEAPTGGYLLSACMATGRAAARGIEAWLAGN